MSQVRVLPALLTLFLAGCAGGAPEKPVLVLEEFARSEQQWTGIAVSRTGRVFVCYPRWGAVPAVAVSELLLQAPGKGTNRPYPDVAWNGWRPGDDPRQRFVCVQALWIDGRDHLWILDPASPGFAGTVPGGPKLVRVDLAADRVVDVIGFPPDLAPTGSYLNDVRVDTRGRHAYLTDSGLGAILVVDLETRRIRRLLSEHPLTRSEGITLRVGGGEWRLPDGRVPEVHADGIALDPEDEWLYFQALSGRNLRRVRTKDLRDESLATEALAERVETVAAPGPVDGIAFGPGGWLWLTSLETGQLFRWKEGRGVVAPFQSVWLAWPDSLAVGPDGRMYVTTARIHEGSAPKGPYQIWVFEP